MAKDSPKAPKTLSSRLATNPSVSIWAAQCEKCLKWRTISTQEEFEEIRSRFIEEPFNCDNKPNGSCDDPADIEYDSSRTWVIDKPNLPKTPSGFKRELYLRKDHSKMDIYYFTPSGKKLRSFTEVGTFLQQNPEFSDIKASNSASPAPKLWMILYPLLFFLPTLTRRVQLVALNEFMDKWSWNCSFAL